MIIDQDYMKESTEKIKGRIGAGKLTVRFKERVRDADKNVNAFVPNFIHSMDAANVHKFMSSEGMKEIKVRAAIHDCIGGRAVDISKMIGMFTVAFNDVYQFGVTQRIQG
jgi:DNA-directed RNA polymerase